MLKVVIDRTKWLRGEEANQFGSSLLCPHSGKYCCLGFAAKEAGATDDEIRDLSTPGALWLTVGKTITESLLRSDRDESKEMNSNLSEALMEINDSTDPDVDAAFREAEVIRLGLEAGIEFSFVN